MANIFNKSQSDYAHLASAASDEQREARLRDIRNHILLMNRDDQNFANLAKLDDTGHLMPADWGIEFGMGSEHTAKLSTDGALTLSINSLEMFANEAVDVLVRLARPLQSLVPVRNVPVNTTRAGWNVIEQSGQVGPVDDWFSNMGTVSIDQSDRSVLIRPYAIKAAWADYTADRLRMANAGITDLGAELGRAATRLCAVYRERIFWVGDPALGNDFSRGLLNYPTTGSDKIRVKDLSKNATGTFGGTNEFANADAELSEWRAVIADIVNNSGGNIAQLPGVLRIALPSAYNDHLWDTYRSTDSDVTLGEEIQRDNAWNRANPGNSTELFTPHLDGKSATEGPYEGSTFKGLKYAGKNNKGAAWMWIVNRMVVEMVEASPPVPLAPMPLHRGVQVPYSGQISPLMVKESEGAIKLNLEPIT